MTGMPSGSPLGEMTREAQTRENVEMSNMVQDG